MSTRSETILAALADGATNRVEIAEATGIEVQAVSQELSILRSKGLADKTPDGWIACDPGAQVRVQAIPQAGTREQQTPSAKQVKKAHAHGKPAAAPRSVSAFEVAAFGDFVVIRRADADRLIALHAALKEAGYDA